MSALVVLSRDAPEADAIRDVSLLLCKGNDFGHSDVRPAPGRQTRRQLVLGRALC